MMPKEVTNALRIFKSIDISLGRIATALEERNKKESDDKILLHHASTRDQVEEKKLNEFLDPN